MKCILLLLILSTVSLNVHAAEKKYFMCEAKVLKELEFPAKGTHAFDEMENKYVAVVESDVLNIFDMSTLEKIESYDVSDFFVDNIFFSPDNRFILVVPKRKNVGATLIDRKTGESKKNLPQDLFWLKNNQLGRMTESEVPAFSFIDPLTLKETQIAAPGLTVGFWYGFNSPDADLVQTDYSPAAIKVYSLKEKKFTKEFHFEGSVKSFEIEKNYAVIEKDKDFSIIRLSDMKNIFSMHSENSVSATSVGSTLYLSDSYGWYSTNEPDRRPYQRAAIDLNSWTVTRSDYTGPWQSLSVVNDHFFSLQVIDTGADRNVQKDYYAIMNNKWEPILKVESPVGGFTFLDRINKSSLFAIKTSDNYEVGKKFQGEVGIFNLKKPDVINYQKMGKVDFNYESFASASADKIITTEYGKSAVLKLWLVNQNCAPAEFRF